MNLHDEIRKMQEQTITIRLQVTDHGSAVLRDMARGFRLEEALELSHDQHMARVQRGLDPRLN